MSFDKIWEENIYSKGMQNNKYPYGELVSVVFRCLKLLPNDKIQNRDKIKVLELGSGAGNNLWFLSEMGFDVYGVDGSESACLLAEKEMRRRNVSPNIQCATFDDLPFGDCNFDIIIDRESTCCGSLGQIKQWWKEADRVLKRGGVIISFKYADDSPDLIRIKEGIFDAVQLEENTYKDMSDGAFASSGTIHFTPYEEIFDIFSFCEIKFINKSLFYNVLDTPSELPSYSEWIIVGVKN